MPAAFPSGPQAALSLVGLAPRVPAGRGGGGVAEASGWKSGGLSLHDNRVTPTEEVEEEAAPRASARSRGCLVRMEQGEAGWAVGVEGEALRSLSPGSGTGKGDSRDPMEISSAG